jgi:hypothetical protein
MMAPRTLELVGKALLDILENAKLLPHATAESYDGVTAWTSKHEWTCNLPLATSCFTFCVSKSTRQDLAKLKQLLEYEMRMEWTRHTRFTQTTKATRVALYFSAGVRLPAQLGKQKLHTKGSTEVELVGVSNYFLHSI